MKKILISACFLGEKVRYDGQANTLTNKVIKQWKNENRLITVCPEVCAGLAIPRIAAEIQPSPLSFNKTLSPSTLRIDSQISKQKQVITQHGENVTEAFYRGANIALNLCLQHNIQFALLKESSPSCGSTTIYDGSFTKIKIKGEGITVELLRKNDIEVFSEENIEELINKLANN